MTNNSSVAAQWLDREDRGDRDNRISRLEWLATLMPDAEYVTYPGGILSKSLFEELRYCYAYGQFIATIMLGLAYIERTLAAEFYASGRNDLERANISTLLREALSAGWITDEEFTQIDKACDIRNTFTHFRRPLHDEGVERRSIERNEPPYTVIEDDARHVIQAAFHVLARNAA
jgi:hypothetical protein